MFNPTEKFFTQFQAARLDGIAHRADATLNKFNSARTWSLIQLFPINFAMLIGVWTTDGWSALAIWFCWLASVVIQIFSINEKFASVAFFLIDLKYDLRELTAYKDQSE